MIAVLCYCVDAVGARKKRHHKEKPMTAFFSTQAGCVVRWLDLPGDGVPLVFVHGLGCASSYEYPRVVCDKNFQGRRAILIDLPGYGYSEKPKEFRYSISEQAAVVCELIAHLQLDDYFLYGHSMGGSIAIEAATQLSGLRGLIVSEPNFRPDGGFFSRQICRVDEETYITHVYALMMNNYKNPWTGSLSAAAPWAVWRGASSLITGNQWFEMFVELNKPICLLFGAESLPDADFTQLSAMGIATVELADCGHNMSWENPPALAAALAAFCTAHE